MTPALHPVTPALHQAAAADLLPGVFSGADASTAPYTRGSRGDKCSAETQLVTSQADFFGAF